MKVERDEIITPEPVRLSYDTPLGDYKVTSMHDALSAEFCTAGKALDWLAEEEEDIRDLVRSARWTLLNDSGVMCISDERTIARIKRLPFSRSMSFGFVYEKGRAVHQFLHHTTIVLPLQ